LAPGDARILLYTAITLRRLGRWDDSISAFEASLKLDPINVFTATQMIDTLTWMQEWDRAESLINQWIIKYPDSRDLKGTQVIAKIRHHGDLKAARDLFNLLPPWQGVVYTTAANSLVSFERDFEAWLELQDEPVIVENSRFGGDVGMTKGIIYHLMGNETQSRKFLQKQIEHSSTVPPVGSYVDAFVVTNMAISWSYLGEHEEALKASQMAKDILPQEKDHLFGTMLAQNHTLLLARAGRREEALTRLEATLDQYEGRTRWALYLDPQWDFFRDDERFNELVRPLNLKEAEK
jgi:tetratricopeptide (TPR) repeat protein